MPGYLRVSQSGRPSGNSRGTYPEQKSIFILGGGSNLLFTKDFEGLVIRIRIPGIEEVKEDIE